MEFVNGDCKKLRVELSDVKKQLVEVKTERDALTLLIRQLGNYSEMVYTQSINKMENGGLGNIEYGTYKGSAILAQQIMTMIGNTVKAKCLFCGLRRFFNATMKVYRWLK